MRPLVSRSRNVRVRLVIARAPLRESGRAHAIPPGAARRIPVLATDPIRVPLRAPVRRAAHAHVHAHARRTVLDLARATDTPTLKRRARLTVCPAVTVELLSKGLFHRPPGRSHRPTLTENASDNSQPATMAPLLNLTGRDLLIHANTGPSFRATSLSK
jgi:hypothetical protein